MKNKDIEDYAKNAIAIVEQLLSERFDEDIDIHDSEANREMLYIEYLKCAIEMQRNDILKQAFHAGVGVDGPEPLEMIAIQFMSK